MPKKDKDEGDDHRGKHLYYRRDRLGARKTRRAARTQRRTTSIPQTISGGFITTPTYTGPDRRGTSSQSVSSRAFFQYLTEEYGVPRFVLREAINVTVQAS